MDIHPWTKYELARIRDEGRLQRAREAALAAETRTLSGDQPQSSSLATSWIGRLRRRHIALERTPARSGA